MKTLVLSLFALVAFPYYAAVANECTQLEAYAAESVTDYLDSWRNVYIFFKQYHHCYDAAIAEGAE